jgi:hypothetical protein
MAQRFICGTSYNIVSMIPSSTLGLVQWHSQLSVKGLHDEYVWAVVSDVVKIAAATDAVESFILCDRIVSRDIWTERKRLAAERA